MSPICGQLSDKPLLAFAPLYGVPDVKLNRDREINADTCLPSSEAETSIQVRLQPS